MEVILHHLEGEGSHRLFGIVVCGEFVCSPPFVYLFNHEFISVWTRIFISSLGFWSSNTSLCCSNCYSFGYWELISCSKLSMVPRQSPKMDLRKKLVSPGGKCFWPRRALLTGSSLVASQTRNRELPRLGLSP